MTIPAFSELKRYIDLPLNAIKLLSKSEKEITFNLSLRVENGKVIDTDSYVVYYNTVRGPAKGGIRISPLVTLDETRDLAERMVYKSALIGIPFGGGKSAIRIDPENLTVFEKTSLIREYCHLLRFELENNEYIPAPDLGSTPSDMAVIYGRFHKQECVTGKPPSIGGLPGRNEATGFGIFVSTKLALDKFLVKKMNETTIAVQGFGNVGSWASYFLWKSGAKIVAVSDIHGGIYDPKGLNIQELIDLRKQSKNSLDSIGGSKISNSELLNLPVDILVPAAIENVITELNAERLQTKMIIEGANGPVTKNADSILSNRGIEVLPDILVNSGGVIASYIEWRKAKSGSITKKEETFRSIEDIITQAFKEIVKISEQNHVSLRTAAYILATHEVVGTMRDRGWI